MDITSIYDWIKKEPVISSVVGSAILAIITLIIKLLQYLIRKMRKKTITEKFPFRRIKPDDLGQWLMEKGDRVRLTCCENPYVPKKPDIIYKSKDIESERRRMYIGTAETGKTRSAYEWIMEMTKDKNAEILIPVYESLPNPISEEEIPHLEETVVLFYDDMHNCLLPSGKGHQKDDSRILSPIDRFEELINLLQKRCTKLYIVCTARWERSEAVKSVENISGIWKTFDIITLRDAERKTEADMITKLANHLNVNLTNSIVRDMTDINQGRSYENTVTFLQGWDKQKTVINANLDDYKKGASERWRENVFFELESQNPLVAQVIGTMYTLRFELGLPLYQRFILICAEIKTEGLFKKHRLKDAMRLMCRHEFHPEGEIVSCPDYQLEIEGRISPSVQECVDRLYSQRKKLFIDERNSLAEWYFSKATEFYYNGKLEPCLTNIEKSALMNPTAQAYQNWGLALYNLAKLKENESLYEQSFQKFQKAVEIKPDFHEAYNNWGLTLSYLARLKGDVSLYEQAIQKFQKAVEIKPDFHEAYTGWGLAIYELARLKGDVSLYEQAIQKYQKTVEIKPDFHIAYHNWGLAIYELARFKGDVSLYEQAIQKFRKTVEIKPDFHEAYTGWGLVLSALAKLKGDESLYEQAIQKYQKAVEIMPDDIAYYNWGLALCYLAELKGDESLYEQAIEKYQKSVEIKPDDHEAYNNWGIALSDLAKLNGDESLYEQAIQKYQKAVEFNPQYWEAYFNMACAYALMKRAREACQALDKAFSINPEVVNKVNTDSDFDPIRDDPIFQQWLKDHNKKA